MPTWPLDVWDPLWWSHQLTSWYCWVGSVVKPIEWTGGGSARSPVGTRCGGSRWMSMDGFSLAVDDFVRKIFDPDTGFFKQFFLSNVGDDGIKCWTKIDDVLPEIASRYFLQDRTEACDRNSSEILRAAQAFRTLPSTLSGPAAFLALILDNIFFTWCSWTESGGLVLVDCSCRVGRGLPLQVGMIKIKFLFQGGFPRELPLCCTFSVWFAFRKCFVRWIMPTEQHHRVKKRDSTGGERAHPRGALSSWTSARTTVHDWRHHYWGLGLHSSLSSETPSRLTSVHRKLLE